MVEWDGKFRPMILTMDEHCETLFQDIRQLLADKDEKFNPKKKQLKVVWGHGRPINSPEQIKLEDSNIIAILRLMKSRNGVDYVATTKYDY